jgi:hypothetical protein
MKLAMCSLAEVYPNALMMKAENTSKMSVNLYHITRYNNLEDNHVYSYSVGDTVASVKKFCFDLMLTVLLLSKLPIT